MEKSCYFFLPGDTVTGSSSDVELLGGKGANLAGMAKLGLPVPPGFTIPTTVCVKYRKTTNVFTKKTMMSSISDMAFNAYKTLVEYTGTPVLVSVRSGARVSMPGMMDTVLNVGITDETLPYWVSKLGERTGLDSYRRLLQMYGEVVLGVDKHLFEQALAQVKGIAGVSVDSELDASMLAKLVDEYKAVYSACKVALPQDMQGQLAGAIEAVFKSWDNPRAKVYRGLHGYPDDWGTAVTVQSMVFGNMNDKSATGVLFSRCPSTGKPGVVGEFLVNAQGEDVVAGIRTPDPLEDMAKWNPEVHQRLLEVAAMLEAHQGDMQDIEFTVQDGELFLLQTRNAKRTHKAAVQVAYAMALEKKGKTRFTEALSKVSAKAFEEGLSVSVVSDEKPDFIGIAAGGDAVRGVIALTSASAVMKANDGKQVILVADETTPDDIAGMAASVGILTRTGGLTSHAAVVARGMNKVCVVGCETLPALHHLPADAEITICGKTGGVWVSTTPTLSEPSTDPMLDTLFEAVCKENGYTPSWVQQEEYTIIDLDAPAAIDGLKRGFVDLATFVSPYSGEQDQKLLASMGIPAEMVVANEALVAMGDAIITLAHDAVVTISCPDWLVGRLSTLLQEAGMDSVKFCKSPRKVSELFDGMVVLDDGCVSELFGNKETAKYTLKLFKDAGKKVIEAPVVKTRAQLVCNFMGGH